MTAPLVRYRNVVFDNSRWDGFTFRDGDIVISTPAKCGTTWTQMICAMLIFQRPDLPKPLDLISPWLDMSTRKDDDVKRDLEAQNHRRFIKSHTPFDGLPYDERVTYITVARDPRDVAISWANHMDNMDLVVFIQQREAAVGLEDLNELLPNGPPVIPEQPIDRFWQWVDEDAGMGGLKDLVNHLKTFWDARDRDNVVLLHYSELKADLEGEMRKLAARLEIEVPEDRWPALVKAATFEEMRDKAVAAAPNASQSLWKDTKRFFNRGTNGQWRDLLSDDDLRRYERRVAELAEPELVEWMHQT